MAEFEPPSALGPGRHAYLGDADIRLLLLVFAGVNFLIFSYSE
jgi:hypothetical protein